MRFVWFWTFWHWSKESYRCGELLQGPLHGAARNWDEWFGHEATPEDRDAIERAGRNEVAQRAFVDWIFKVWLQEAGWGDRPQVASFILAKLAPHPPFDRWGALASFRSAYGCAGVSALVLAGDSPGEAADVRPVEALLLPADSASNSPKALAEEFEENSLELDAAWRATRDVVSGGGFARLLWLWAIAGRRPHPNWVKWALAAGWVAVAALIARLALGSDPGPRFVVIAAWILGLWAALSGVGVFTILLQVWQAWRVGRRMRVRFEREQARLRMPGGLILKGGSAGFAFSLNMLLALLRAEAGRLDGSWLWRSVARRLEADAPRMAATGIVRPNGALLPVVLGPKFRACLRHAGIREILTPKQPGSGGRIARADADRNRSAVTAQPAFASWVSRVGLAVESDGLASRPCGNLAQGVLRIGRLESAPQVAMNALAIGVSLTAFAAWPDLKSELFPARAPELQRLISPTAYQLWIGLDTESPERFRAVLQSDHWASRIADPLPFAGPDAKSYASFRLRRLSVEATRNSESGTVWIERRPRFLWRDYGPGERIGRYSISYLMSHETH